MDEISYMKCMDEPERVRDYPSTGSPLPGGGSNPPVAGIQAMRGEERVKMVRDTLQEFLSCEDPGESLDTRIGLLVRETCSRTPGSCGCNPHCPVLVHRSSMSLAFKKQRPGPAGGTTGMRLSRSEICSMNARSVVANLLVLEIILRCRKASHRIATRDKGARIVAGGCT